MPYMVDKITTTLPALKGVIGADLHGHAALLDTVKFQATAVDIVNGALADANEENNAQGKSATRGERKQMLARWMQLWSPYDQKLVVFDTELPDGSLATTPSSIADPLAAHWGAVFSAKDIDERFAQAVTRRCTETSLGTGNTPATLQQGQMGSRIVLGLLLVTPGQRR